MAEMSFEERREPPGLLDVLLFVSAHYQVEGNLALGICKYTWNDELLWSSLIEMLHSVTNKKWKLKDASTATRLMLACKMGRLDVVQKLLDLGAKIETRSASGNTALIFASREGHVHVARYLLDEKHADIETRTDMGWSPLMIASQYGQVAMIEFLCDRCVDIDAINNANNTALAIACYFAQIEAACMLLARGANVDAGHASILWACKPLDNNHLFLLDDASTLWTRRCEIVRVLVRANANLHVTSANGRTPLQLARSSNQQAVEVVLLEALLAV